MSEAGQNQLVAELARDLVREVAPEELPLFRAQSQAYFQDPERSRQPQAGRDDMLGFGVAEAVTFLTPVILTVLSHVVVFMADEIKKGAKEQSAALIQDTIKALFRSVRPAASAVSTASPLTPAQITRVREIAFEQAKRCNVPDDHAHLLADAVAGRLTAAG